MEAKTEPYFPPLQSFPSPSVSRSDAYHLNPSPASSPATQTTFAYPSISTTTAAHSVKPQPFPPSLTAPIGMASVASPYSQDFIGHHYPTNQSHYHSYQSAPGGQQMAISSSMHSTPLTYNTKASWSQQAMTAPPPNPRSNRDYREKTVEEKIYELKKVLIPNKEMSLTEIFERTKINPWDDPELLREIRSKPLFGINDEHRTIILKPKHEAQSRESLCDLLRSKKGTLMTEILRDAYAGAAGDLEEMEKSRNIYLIENKDQKCKAIFWNKIDPQVLRMEVAMNSEKQKALRDSWASIKVPEIYTDIVDQLRDTGHDIREINVPVYGNGVVQQNKKKKTQKRMKNITNTHLEGKEGDVTQEIKQDIASLPDRDVVE